MLLICLECLVGAVSQLLAIHFSPLMTSHPPCNVRRSTDPKRPLSGSIKLLYHITAVPFFGGRIRLAEPQFMLRLISSVLSISLKYKKRNNKVVMFSEALPNVCGYIRFCNFFFQFRIQNFPSPHRRRVFKSNSPVLTHPMVSGFTLEKLGLHGVPPYWFIVR